MKNDKQILKFDPKNWDWYAYLDASEEVKEEYNNEAYDLSSDWVTCACGQVCSVLPKGEHANAPLDNELGDLGVDFCSEIEIKDWGNAKTTLDKIEKRTIFLLQQLNYTDPKTL
tara:strand:+ start:2811 stop:3152 length:342 start_codon:yes stop_codon:yes gene_type:complete